MTDSSEILRSGEQIQTYRHTEIIRKTQMPRPTNVNRGPWTPRKDGTVRCTMKMELHIPRDLVTFIRDNEKCNEAKALLVIREISRQFDEWHTVGYLPIRDENLETRELILFETDELFENPNDYIDYTIYEGPKLAWS